MSMSTAAPSVFSTQAMAPHALLGRPVQTAVLPPAADAAPAQPQQSAASKRSFKSFVDAMDDMNFDRRDVAGMRQLLAMQKERQAAAQAAAAQQPAAQAAAAQQPAAPNVSSFAPQIDQPDVPVVQGPLSPYASVPSSSAQPYGTMPALPQLPPAGLASSAPPPLAAPALPVQQGALPALPQNAAPALFTPASFTPASLTQAPPGPGHVVAYFPANPAPAGVPASAQANAQTLPAQLRSPLVDEARAATRNGPRPGLSDEALARFAAAANRQRGGATPLPPALQAQQARWNRDPWPANVSTARTTSLTPAPITSAPISMAANTPAASGLPSLPALPTQSAANELPQLPTLPAVQ